MKWFKHDSNANMDDKLQEILLDYGLEGYGLYWYCIELISSKVETDNLTFELRHDARVIARNTGSTVQKVSEMMSRFVDMGLFEASDGVITCLKLAKRIDQSMTSNPAMREMIKNIKNHDKTPKNHDSIMTESSKPMQDKNRLEENRLDKNNKNQWTPPEGLNLEAWADYEQHRKTTKGKFTDLARTKAANVIKDLSHAEQQATIDKSIQSGWPGLFPDKSKKSASQDLSTQIYKEGSF